MYIGLTKNSTIVIDIPKTKIKITGPEVIFTQEEIQYEPILDFQYNPKNIRKFSKKFVYQLNTDEIKYIAYHMTSYFIFPNTLPPRYLVVYRKIIAFMEVIAIDLYMGAYIFFHGFVQYFNFARDKNNDIIFKFINLDGEECYIKENEDKIEKLYKKAPQSIVNIWQKVKSRVLYGEKQL